ncbi:MAG: hypothetical protein IJ025_06655 [Clostridia bacterium]|nr:hypothetical protein [Clostridia bacterium]
MKNKKRILTISLSVFIVVAIVFVVFFGIKSYNNKGKSGSDNQNAKDATMLQLITTPEKYDGEFVRVIGVSSYGFEKCCITLSKEDLKYSIGNSIWIELGENTGFFEELTQYNGEYVIVEGIFDKDDCGHLGQYCGSIKSINRYELWNSYLITHSMITQEKDKTYSYEITDYKGKILDYENNLRPRPERLCVDTDVVGISVQMGTGLSTNYAKFYDLETGEISKIFYYVIDVEDDCVVYADYRDGEHFIIVEDIFDKDQYYREYRLENVSPVVADFVVSGGFNRKGNINITYLSGDDYTETIYTIVMEPKGKAE